jgi:hypothetical protein
MHINDAINAIKIVPPNPFQELLARKHTPRHGSQRVEQIELTRRQCHRHAAPLHFSSRNIDLKIVKGQECILRWRRRPRMTPAAQDRFDARHEFTRAERFGQIVIGAHRQTNDLIDLLRACSQHEDVWTAIVLQAATNFKTINSRKQEVEHNQVRTHHLRLLQCRFTVTRSMNDKAVSLEIGDDQIQNRLLILNNEDRSGHIGYLTVSEPGARMDVLGARLLLPYVYDRVGALSMQR